jgi:TatD DNase family protein
LEKHRPRGAILHWFTGDSELVARATLLGCGFSVNAVMSDAQLLALPRERVLPETDFPLARAKGAVSRPGDMSALENRLAALWGETPATTRMRFFQNLKDLAVRSGALDRFPERLADTLIAA